MGLDTGVVAHHDLGNEQIADLLHYPNLLLGLSDAGAHTSQLCDANYATWLLGHWWRGRGTLSLEQAVWRLTDHLQDALEELKKAVAGKN